MQQLEEEEITENYGMKLAQKKKDRMYLMISFQQLSSFKMKRDLRTANTPHLMEDPTEEQ